MRKPHRAKGSKPKEQVEVEAVKAVSSEVDTDFVIYETSAIPEVQTVRLYRETVEKIRMGHPEVPIGYPSMDAAVQKGLTAPTHIESRKTGSYLFVDATSTNSTGDPMRIPVKIIDGTSGRLQSVYFASTTDESPYVIWRSKNDSE